MLMLGVFLFCFLISEFPRRVPMNQGKTARAWAKETIQNAGLRATPARMATLLVLRDASAPLTHAEVSARLAKQDIDKATVFRNLNDMVAASLLRRSELGDRVWRFEMISDEDQGPGAHQHFVCIGCGTVSCLTEIELTKKSKSASKRIGHVTEILLRGHCHDCV